MVVFCASNAAAQSYPAKPIRFLVPYAPGGVGDITARLVAQKMSENMGQQVIVENRPSAGLVVATEMAAKADPDGYTIALIGNGATISASLFKSLPFDLVSSFTHISTIGFFDVALLAAAESRFKTVADVLAYARANPGKLNIGTINIGSTQHLAAELFKSMAGLDAQTVPFRATSAVVTALRSNDVDVAFEILAPVLSQIRSNSLRVLAIGSDRRFPGLPDVPTIIESGLAGYRASSWNGISITARAPKAIIERLNREIAAAVNAPDMQRKLQELGIQGRPSTSEEMRALVVADTAKWKAVIERAGIPPQ
jgi:tripartite-type tricarboxylate transporter receptor subunit TctC